MRYPSEIKFAEIVKLYFGIETFKYDGKYIIVENSEGDICCMEKFGKPPKSYTRFFCLNKSSNYDSVITFPEIKKKIPDLTIDESEICNFYKLKKHISNYNIYPTDENKPGMFQHIKDICESKDHLSNEEISNYEALPGWKWDYSRLTRKGVKWEAAIDRHIKSTEHIGDEIILKKIVDLFKKKELSPYFEKLVRIHGLNVTFA